MKKTMTFLLLLAILIAPVKAAEVENVKPVKNVILLIPDGTSLATVSIARWLQWYNNPGMPNLNITKKKSLIISKPIWIKTKPK